MSENLMFAWISSLSMIARSHLMARIIRSDAPPALTVLAAFSEASGLSPEEVSGLLPAAISQAEAAATGLVHTHTQYSSSRQAS
jgi:hypothetical protein